MGVESGVEHCYPYNNCQQVGQIGSRRRVLAVHLLKTAIVVAQFRWQPIDRDLVVPSEDTNQALMNDAVRVS